MRMFRTYRLYLVCTACLLAMPIWAFAHVKWFSDYSFAERPLALDEILTPLFGILFAASTLGVAGVVVLDERLIRLPAYASFTSWLSRFENRSDLFLRVAVGSVLLLSWQSGSMLVPEIPSLHAIIDLAQLVIALLILANRLTAYAGYGLFALYGLAFWHYGALHLLDYAYLLGAGYYLVAMGSPRKKMRASALPGLYASVGFSLCWVALEKLFYPQWGLEILQERPFLTLGFEPGFFLTSAAFVEFTLGFLLIVCLVQRPLALAVTGLFMTTTLVFGKLEFIGHAIVHAALIVFILKGRGDIFRTPITFFYHLWQRIAFAIVSFVALYILMLTGYSQMSTTTYLLASQQQQTEQQGHMGHVMPATSVMWSETEKPVLLLDVSRDSAGGWNVHLSVDGFTFVPEQAGRQAVAGEGHAHLYVDDRKVARMYSTWHYLDTLTPGTHEVRVVLNTNDHQLYVYDGRPLEARCTVVVE